MSIYDFQKISHIIAFDTVYKFDIICLSETFLNSDFSLNDENMRIPGFTLTRKDHPSNIRRGGVCVYHKIILPIRILDVIFLQECINFELLINDKLCSFVSLYRSPSQTNDQFEEFIKNLELNLEYVSNKNPFLIVLIGDFNAKSEKWLSNSTTSHEGEAIDLLASQYGLTQLIKEPTFILNNHFSCIDLIFSSQPNLVMDSGTIASLHMNCHHQLIYAKFNLKIFYPPPYKTDI